MNSLLNILLISFVVALMNFGMQVEASETAAKKADLVRGEQIAAQQCAACHMADGNSVVPGNPKLAGQSAAYLYKQLINFKVMPGTKEEAERSNPIMSGIASILSDEDMKNVAAFFASKTMKPDMAKAGAASVELGQKIYRGGIASINVAACAGCHGPAGAGIPNQFPRLGGQHAEYIEAQLMAFRNNARKNSTQMSAIAARMSDAEIKAVADYIAGLR